MEALDSTISPDEGCCIQFSSVHIKTQQPFKVITIFQKIFMFIHLIFFVQGTTGKPKAIVLSHLGMVNNGYYNGKRFCLYEKVRGSSNKGKVPLSDKNIDDAVLIVLQHHTLCLQVPLFHVFGSIICLGSSFNHGATMVLPFKDYNTKKALAAARSEK